MSDSSTTDHPQMLPAEGTVEPVPRRIRAMRGGRVVLDTVDALYHWKHVYYPELLIPAADVDPDVLRDLDPPEPRPGTVRLDWDSLDAWFEEDEQVFGHPRSPYVRVDALRSSQHVRVELGGVVLAETDSPVLVFETGLPTRTYIDPVDVDLSALVASPTQTLCPYKGVTSQYWSAAPHVPGAAEAGDIAWSYHHPTTALAPVTGLVAFYDERVQLTRDRGGSARRTVGA